MDRITITLKSSMTGTNITLWSQIIKNNMQIDYIHIFLILMYKSNILTDQIKIFYSTRHLDLYGGAAPCLTTYHQYYCVNESDPCNGCQYADKYVCVPIEFKVHRFWEHDGTHQFSFCCWKSFNKKRKKEIHLSWYH